DPGLGWTLNCSSPTPDSLFQELQKDLFSKKLIRPVKNLRHSTNISLSITVVGILGVVICPLVSSAAQEWDIEGLSWDEQECGIRRISVPRDMLWSPDVHVVQLYGSDVDSASPQTPFVYLDNSGRVFDDRPLRLVTSCRLEIYYFPFDVQNCSLTFGSYLHFDITVSAGSSAADVLSESTDVIYTQGEWELVGISIAPSVLDLDVGSYSEITYFLTLRRSPALYVVNLLIPSGFLITVDLFSFLLPPTSVDRSSFKMTLILGYTVFLLIMNDLLPSTGNATPLISVFFSISLALMVASLLETVFITHLQLSSTSYRAVPHWLSVLVLHYLAVIVCFPPLKKIPGLQNISGDTLTVQQCQDPVLDELRKMNKHLGTIRLQMEKQLQSSRSSQDWQTMGVIIDRLLFGLYILFISVSFITIICIWTFSSSLAT
uniref:Uncharacterized protein n=1 Tax=Sphaeramia orbicularis TaxID=375764 RepID=A0A672YH46_9TELE